MPQLVKAVQDVVFSTAFVSPKTLVGSGKYGERYTSLFTVPKGHQMAGATSAAEAVSGFGPEHTNLTRAGELGDLLGDMAIMQCRIKFDAAQDLDGGEHGGKYGYDLLEGCGARAELYVAGQQMFTAPVSEWIEVPTLPTAVLVSRRDTLEVRLYLQKPPEIRLHVRAELSGMFRRDA